jgi:hypothetical protein
MPGVKWYIQKGDKLSEYKPDNNCIERLTHPVAGFMLVPWYGPHPHPRGEKQLLYSGEMLERFNEKLLGQTALHSRQAIQPFAENTPFGENIALPSRHVILIGLHYCEQVYFYHIKDTRSEITSQVPQQLLLSQYDEWVRYALCVHAGVRNVPFSILVVFEEVEGKEYPKFSTISIYPGFDIFWYSGYTNCIDSSLIKNYYQWVEDRVFEHETGDEL